MLIAKALGMVLGRRSMGQLTQLSNGLAEDHIAPLLLDCLHQTLTSQHLNGSWGSIGPYEETAYAVLTLISISGLPLPANLRQLVELSIHKGRTFLRSKGNATCEYLWIEKISYGSQYLMDAYVLAALHAETHLLPTSGIDLVLPMMEIPSRLLQEVGLDTKRMTNNSRPSTVDAIRAIV